MRYIATVLIAAIVALGSSMRPAAADQAAATRNLILGAAAAIAIGVTAANVAHKRAVANNVVGYTPDGSTVYQDGHVVTSSGQSYYPSHQGQQVSCNNGYCSISGNGYNPYGYNQYGYNQYGYNPYGYNGYGYNPYGR